MFTGIIEEMGKLRKMQKGRNSVRLTIEANIVLDRVNLGDSIAVNGICLTVVNFSNRSFEVDVMAETLRKTNLEALKPGERVKLERALRVDQRLGGHIVSGHIDGVGEIVHREEEDIAVLVDIRAPGDITKYIIPKGSVAIDGISLTVAKCESDIFRVSLIPHTAGLTTIGYKGVGDRVNLEADVIGKYVERLLGFQYDSEKRSQVSGLTMEYLAENGFL